MRSNKYNDNIINNDSIIFQVISWNTCDYLYNEDDEREASNSENYLIKIFGVTEDGKSISVNVLNYTPYFYIKILHKIDRNTTENLREHMVSELPYHLKNSLINVTIVRQKDFWGFTNNEKFNFARFKFKNLKGYRSAIKILSKKFNGIKYKLYESNIEPFLRMIHIRNIDPSGWVKVINFNINDNIIPTHCQIDINCDWKSITKITKEKIAPLLIASFDIECISSHGDFPVAKKTYSKVAYEVLQYFNSNKYIDNIKDTILTEILKIFKYDEPGIFSKVFPKNQFNYTLIEKKLHNGLIDDLFAILISKVKYNDNDGDDKIPTKDSIMESLTEFLGYYQKDPDNNSERWKGIFPELEGDPIIQIGTTVHKYGEKECCYKNIITLDTCNDIEGSDVISCKNEKELLLQWRDLIIRLDPDILTGYNILGFDMSYIYERSKQLEISYEFCKIGRYIDHSCNFEEKNLSSSALGENLLKYINMDGRVIIDIMKVVQRDYKLDSYSLNAVATHFMKMKKHDVHPADIFRLQKGTSEDRTKIAAYCIQDCTLCNNLMIKLEILANNIGMSNVCSVPLSYIFFRGQGIKIFSLVAKECREYDFLIPTINSYIKDIDEEQDDEGYEGAIVFEPKEGIYIDDPISVLDYASLYPSSMISENLSHDCIILNEKYNNLPGQEYLDISYDIYEKINDKKVKTGIKTVRFAQFPNREKGTIPKILMKLLKQRKETRKKIEFRTIITKSNDNNKEEFIGLFKELNDSKVLISTLDGKSIEILKENIISNEDTYNTFQKAVLDGLQLAYKVTANSLYGQCGAKTSSIFMKEIAACTTATGRKMLTFARDFILDNYKSAEIIYGDSVTGDTPLLIKFQDNTIDIITIESLSNNWIEYPGFKLLENDVYEKEQSFINAKIWTNGEWSDIKRVIRHKCKKKIYRVNTFKGSIDVTEDHSLIDINGYKIKPSECIEGETEILHTFPDKFNEIELKTREYISDKYKIQEEFDNYYKCKCCDKIKENCEFYTKINTKILNLNIKTQIITKEEAWVWGFFFGDGSCEKYNCESGIEATWAINNSNLDYLNRARDYLLLTEPKEVVSNFKILDTIDSSAVYKLSPVGSAKYMVEKYRELFYDKDNFKKVPKIILNATLEVREWFMEGYLTTDGCKKSINNGGLNFACKGKIGAQGLYYIAKSIGWTRLRINIHEYKENTYWIYNIRRQTYFDDNENQIKKIFDLEKINNDNNNIDKIVYDIETSSGKFHGGVGEILVSNTDSAFIKFNPIDALGNPIKGKEAILPSIKLAMEASDKINKILKPPHNLEYEKTFYPFILFSKKRYCANKYEFDDVHYKQNSMGISIKRRDNANIVKIIFGGILNIILNEQDIKKSIVFLKESLQNLIDGKYPIEDLIITKALRSNYKDPEKIAHKVLADRITIRDPGNKPQVNDRLSYVYIETKEKEKGKKLLQGDKIETPEYIREHNLKIDYEFYITNQLMKPILQLYALIIENLDGYRFKKFPNHFKEIKDKLIKEKENDMKKVLDRLHDLREEEVKKILFDNILIKLKNKKNGIKPIEDYFKIF